MSRFNMPSMKKPNITGREAGFFGAGATIASAISTFGGYFFGSRNAVRNLAKRVNALEQEKAELEKALAENDLIIEKITAQSPDLVEQVLTDMDDELALQDALERTKKMMAVMAEVSGLSPEEMKQAQEIAFGALGIPADSITSIIDQPAETPVDEPVNVVVVPAKPNTATVPANPATTDRPVSHRQRNKVAAAVTTGMKEGKQAKEEKEPVVE